MTTIAKSLARSGWAVLVLLPVSLSQPSNVSTSFPGLAMRSIDNWARVIYDSSKTVLLTEQYEDDGPGSTVYKVIQGRFGSDAAETYRVDFCRGASDRPEFRVFRVNGGQSAMIGEIVALELLVPGNGFIYASGRPFQYFNKRSKYALTSTQLTEIEQPFYYVGLESYANEALTLYSDTTYKKVVATLPAKSPVHVVLSTSDETYLIKTPLGLLGWAHIPTRAYTQQQVIEGLGYDGP